MRAQPLRACVKEAKNVNVALKHFFAEENIVRA